MKLRNKIIGSLLSGLLVISLAPHAAFAEKEDLNSVGDENKEMKVDAKADEKKDDAKTDGKKDENKESTVKKKSKVLGNAAKDKIGKILGIPVTPDKLLEKIAETGVELFFKHVVDVAWDTDFANQEEQQAKILRIVQEMKEQVDRIEKTTDQTYIRVKQAALETPLNNFLKDLSQVKHACNDLTDLYKKAISVQDENERDEAIEKFKNDNLDRLRNLTIKLNILFDSATVVVQGRGTQDVISVHDQLMAESYNFANGVPFEQRMQFRNSLASTWVYGALIASVLGQGSTADSYQTQMNAMYMNGKKLNTLLNKTHFLDEKQVEKFQKDGARSVYCYTTQCFVTLRDGEYFGGWKEALRGDLKGEIFQNRQFNIGVYWKNSDNVRSPFGSTWKVNFFSESRSKSFNSEFLNMDQIKMMLAKLPSGISLYDEMKNHGLDKKQDGTVIYSKEKLNDKGLLVGGEKFVHNGWNNVHKYSMDLYNMKDKQGANPEMDKVLLKARTGLIRKGRRNAVKRIFVDKITDPASLFVLAK